MARCSYIFLYKAYIVGTMKLVYLAMPFLGSLAIAQSFVEGGCQCPQVKCPSTDTFASSLDIPTGAHLLTYSIGGLQMCQSCRDALQETMSRL